MTHDYSAGREGRSYFINSLSHGMLHLAFSRLQSKVFHLKDHFSNQESIHLENTHIAYYVYLRDSSAQSCTDPTELQTQLNSTSPVGMAGTHFLLPIHSDYSMSPRDTCTGWGTLFQVDSNVQQSRRAVVSGYLQFLISINDKGHQLYTENFTNI